MLKKIFKNIPFARVNWITSSFLIGTLVIALTATPWYIYAYGLDWFQVALFIAFYCATGFSITLGYHRLFSHLAFKAKWPIRLFTLIFGSATFENSALDWCSDHRRHHKHVDHEGDPYDITKGFWFAHIGWLMFKLNPEPPMDNVNDLRKDPLVMWQHKWNVPISIIVGFLLPTAIGFLYGGAQAALGAFLIAGVARIVTVQQGTFCINSLCHMVGKRPYSTKCSARDSWIAALLTYGEGYHNYHHEFQHDYRNGVKPWQFDPTKWIIWTLSKCGLTSDLRRVPEVKILLAEMTEAKKRIESGLETYSFFKPEHRIALQNFSEKLHHSIEDLKQKAHEQIEISHDVIENWRKEICFAFETLEQKPVRA